MAIEDLKVLIARVKVDTNARLRATSGHRSSVFKTASEACEYTGQMVRSFDAKFDHEALEVLNRIDSCVVSIKASRDRLMDNLVHSYKEIKNLLAMYDGPQADFVNQLSLFLEVRQPHRARRG